MDGFDARLMDKRPINLHDCGGGAKISAFYFLRC